MNHVTSPNEPYPSGDNLAAATRRYDCANWTVTARKLPISRAVAIDHMAARIGIPIPEMIFGDNEVALRHRPTGWTIRFVALDALDAVDKTGEGRLQVAHAVDWARTREMDSVEGIQDVRAYDWSYSTSYRGTEERGTAAAAQAQAQVSPAGVDMPAQSPQASSGEGEPPRPLVNGIHAEAATTDPTTAPTPTAAAAPGLAPAPDVELPLALLRRRDPILFHDDVILYESELDDNGLSMVRVKVRVMPARLLLLCRLYMRLDHVVVRVRDTRVYVDLAADEVLREYTAREDAFANVRASLAARRGLPPDAIIAAMRDADQVADLLPIVAHSMERVVLGPGAAAAATAAEGGGGSSTSP